MSKKITALFLVVAMTVCMAMPVFAGVTDWNTPTTSTTDTNQTSVCEVTAEINYAYYVSMPATLALEPDAGENAYKAEYQVKAKLAGSGLPDSKNIKIAPEIKEGATKPQVELVNTVDSSKKFTADITQGKTLFGADNTATTVKVDNTKWSTIDGKVTATINVQGSYAGNFNFVYGLEAVPTNP